MHLKIAFCLYTYMFCILTAQKSVEVITSNYRSQVCSLATESSFQTQKIQKYQVSAQSN